MRTKFVKQVDETSAAPVLLEKSGKVKFHESLFASIHLINFILQIQQWNPFLEIQTKYVCLIRECVSKFSIHSSLNPQ